VYFKYGSYTHGTGEIDVVNMTMRRMYSQRNRLMFRRWTMTLMGHFCIQTSEDQDTIKSKIEDIKAAYKDGADAVLYHDDGTESSHSIIASKCINSTRVLALSFPKGGDGEYATGRTYQIQIQGDEYITDADVSGVTAFQETVQNIGTGGKRWQLVPQFIGPPRQINIAQQTPQRVVQAGKAEGLYGWLTPPGPMVNAMWEHQDRRMVQYSSPKLLGHNADLMWPTEWRYEFSVPSVGQAAFPHSDWS